MRVSRRGSRWAAALGISGATVLGFAGAAEAGRISVEGDCYNPPAINWAPDPEWANVDWLYVTIDTPDGRVGPLPKTGTMAAGWDSPYTITFWVINEQDGDEPWNPTTVRTPVEQACTAATTIPATPTTTATTTTVTAPPMTGPSPVPTTVPERTVPSAALDLDKQELPATGGRLTLTFWGAAALAVGASLEVLRRRFRPVA